ncbi:4346_t:CDS:2 [Ambispora gerdemannii]|uniref:4346_t:CDS:1 n=1 Tax=Ambispora gerdemannii TaxID=144530 RepID=A0A9N9GDZ5_9GLOM|nr:4346_t:CDS:2 [Ambispora gerdemannii]
MRIRQGKPGRFAYPPPSDKGEENFQEYFIQECSALKEQSIIYDTSKTPFLGTRKPDFVFIHRDHYLDPLNVAIVGEIRKRTGKQFKKVDIGHCISFAEKALQLQPRRAFIYAILTDCYVIVIYKKYFLTLLPQSLNSLGWIEPSLIYDDEIVELKQLIGVGRTSVVFKGKYRDVGTSIVITPVCNKIRNLEKGDIKAIVKTLEMIHKEFKIIHRDLRPKYNLLRDDSGKIVIFDWGFSIESEEEASFAGALECLGNNILEALANNQTITYTPSVDLVCLVFWSNNANSPMWTNIYEKAMQLDYDGLVSALEEVF